jgi:hypothetical protein
MNLKHAGQVIAREVKELIPPTLFFFVAFSLLMLTQILVLKDHGIDGWDWGAAAIGALIVGKVVLVADHFRFVDRYPEKPLIWNAVWKTLIYLIAATIVRYLEALLPLLFHGEGFAEANRTIAAESSWERFVLVHMWLAVLLFVYCCLRELVRHIGPKKVARMFFHAREA